MFGCIDLVGLLFGTMVEPEYHIAIITIFVVEVGTSHAHGLVCVTGEDGEGAGSIEANSSDRRPVNVVLIEGLTN